MNTQTQMNMSMSRYFISCNNSNTFFLDRYAWKCNAVTNVSVATFTDSYPPIFIAHIRHLPKRSEEGFDDYVPRLRDMKHEIRINSIR
jgi:hypothetical protein